MSLSIGDYVLVLDEDLSGVIKHIIDDQATIETDDGFLFDFQLNELVKSKTDDDISGDFLSPSNVDRIISEKEQSSKRKQPKVRPKERYEPTMEVDLHINQLTQSTRGMTHHDMLTLQLDAARKQLEFAIRKRIQKVVFIHGVGEGILKIELEYLFGRYNNVKFHDANYKKYGLGATEVYIHQNPKKDI